MPDIYLVHPIDENLQFLKKVVKALSKDSPTNLNYVKLSNTVISHEECLARLRNANVYDTIILFCHGRTDGILGCRYRADYPNHRRGYDHGLLIEASNIDIFQDRKIICLACESNQVGRDAIAAGAKVFLGFDKININNNQDIHIRANAKHALGQALYHSLNQGIHNNYSFYQLADDLKLFLNKMNDSLILEHKTHRGYKYYHQAANILQEIKEGIRVWGDGNIRIIH